jgi:2-amino-4-hydroxy-6-hydroxymethyldihydropteridine diphosphokinase
VDLPGLTVPHPRLAGRRFALEPLHELDPALRLPDGRAVRELLGAPLQ